MEIFVWGVIFAFFTILPSSRKFPPCENKNPHAFMKEIGEVSWKLNAHEMSCQYFSPADLNNEDTPYYKLAESRSNAMYSIFVTIISILFDS